jgi:predicted DsbA family dithiol-disulfide isomerase
VLPCFSAPANYFGIFIPHGVPDEVVKTVERIWADQIAKSDALKKYAADLGLDGAKFNQCLDSSKYEARVQDALGAGGRLGITSTPTVFVNGRMINGAQPIEVFESVIDDELTRAGK